MKIPIYRTVEPRLFVAFDEHNERIFGFDAYKGPCPENWPIIRLKATTGPAPYTQQLHRKPLIAWVEPPMVFLAFLKIMTVSDNDLEEADKRFDALFENPVTAREMRDVFTGILANRLSIMGMQKHAIEDWLGYRESFRA